MDSKELKEFWKKLDREDKEICDFIYKKAGLKVRSINDFTNKKNYNYDIAIPAICECLKKKYEQNTHEMLLRGLINKKAKGIANEYVLDFFETKVDESNRYMIGVVGMVMKYIVIDTDYDRLYKIIKSAKKCGSFSDFILAIAKNKSQNERTKKLLEQILKNEDLIAYPNSFKQVLRVFEKIG